jgi:hypothetical protein
MAKAHHRHLEIAHATQALYFADTNELRYESLDDTGDIFCRRLFTAFPEKQVDSAVQPRHNMKKISF